MAERIVLPDKGPMPVLDERDRYTRGMEHLVDVVQELSLARSLEEVQRIVRGAARRLTGADGATFVLRDGDHCFYADEDAISPLWKGSRFPMTTCISGWAMLNRAAAVIEDIYLDDRIPHDAYRPTFVKSLVMVPIRTVEPIGAIGNYWATKRNPTESEVRLLRALADITAVTLENVQVYNELEQRVRDRTAELEALNRTVREFVAVAAHDLRGPLSAIQASTELLIAGKSAHAGALLGIIERQSEQMDRIVSDLMTLSLYDTGHLEVKPETVPVRDVATIAATQVAIPVAATIPDDLRIHADPTHIQRIVANFLRNAEKYGRPPVVLEAVPAGDAIEIRVADHGPGVPEGFEDQLFRRFSRAKTTAAEEGAGLGLSIAAVLARANGGEVAYEPNRPNGARFIVRLPAA